MLTSVAPQKAPQKQIKMKVISILLRDRFQHCSLREAIYMSTLVPIARLLSAPEVNEGLTIQRITVSHDLAWVPPLAPVSSP